MNNLKSALTMKNFYFSKINFENLAKPGNEKLNIGYKVNYFYNEQNDNLIKIVFETIITSENENFFLSLDAVGIFEICPEGLDEVQKNFILKKNTVAIMFPFIRSQVSLITTQPGLKPVLLQPIDVNSLVEQKD